MSRYPVSYYLKNAFVKAAVPLWTAATFIGCPGAVYYANEDHTPLSDQRTPVTGDAQYAALKAAADSIVAKDQTVQKMQVELHALEQNQISHPSDAQQSDIKKRTEAAVNLHNEMKEDFRVFTRKMMNSEGISEKDAIALGQQIEYNTKYAAFTYAYQTNLSTKMRHLDECQISTGQQVTDVDTRISATESCVNEYKPSNNGQLAVYYAISLIFGGLFSGMIFLGSREGLEENIKKQKEKIDKERLKSATEPVVSELGIKVIQRSPRR